MEIQNIEIQRYFEDWYQCPNEKFVWRNEDHPIIHEDEIYKYLNRLIRISKMDSLFKLAEENR